VGQGEVGERATAVDATGRVLGQRTPSGVTGAPAGPTVTAVMSDTPTSQADSGRLAAHAKQQCWATGGKLPKSGKLSLTRRLSEYPYGAPPATKEARQRVAAARLRESARQLDASLSNAHRKEARRRRQEAIALRTQLSEQAEDEWLRGADWSDLEGGGGQDELAEEGVLLNSLGACSVCEQAIAGTEGGGDLRLDCAICGLAFHAACYCAPGVLSEHPVSRWQAEGVWICGICVEGDEPSSFMVVHASGGLEQGGEPQPVQTDVGSREMGGRRRTRGEGLLTGHSFWRGGGVVSAALNLSVVFKGAQLLFPSARKCASCWKLTKMSRCSCGWDTVTVLRQHLELRDLLTGRHSWAVMPKFCPKCTAWMPWKCWSAGAAAAAGGLLDSIESLGLDVFEEATTGSLRSRETGMPLWRV